MRDSSERQYTREWLQRERPQPMYDNSINLFYSEFFTKSPIEIEGLDQLFKDRYVAWLKAHDLNSFRGLDAFKRVDVIHGVTQFIDDLYMRTEGKLMVLEGDYKYHWRLNNDIVYTSLEKLFYEDRELLISVPFPKVGDVHPDMKMILDECAELDIPVHIDAAWCSACRDIDFDFNHPAIQTIGFSLSKGGLGGNRIGVRLSRIKPEGAITIMNDFNMNPQSLMALGIAFMDKFGTEYFWKKYGEAYTQVCKDFNLTPTKSIHLALDGSTPVGVRPLLRALTSSQRRS